MLVSLSDQGGINRSGLDYLTSKLGMPLHVSFDPYHRSWNDVKLSLKSSKGDLFKCLLSYSLLYNINYGPFGSKSWHEKKQQKLRELLESGSAHREPFLSFIPWICLEREIPELNDAQERLKLFDTLSEMNSVRSLGPVVKLMRFFSFFQSDIFYHGEVWATKLIMLETDRFSVTDGADFVRSEESLAVPDAGVSDKEQLRALKAKHGSWGLAPLLVTPTSFWQKKAIVLLANACWSAHALMSKNMVTPSQCAYHTVAQSLGGWKSEVLDLMLGGFSSSSTLKKLYPFQSTSESTKEHRLGIHYDFLVTLMGRRASSLASQFLRPPLRYSGLLSDNADQVKATQTKMQAEGRWCWSWKRKIWQATTSELCSPCTSSLVLFVGLHFCSMGEIVSASHMKQLFCLNAWSLILETPFALRMHINQPRTALENLAIMSDQGCIKWEL